MGKYAAQENYSKRQREKGHIRVTVWVPETDKNKLIKYAAKLCRATDSRAA